ncbi:MAG: hypothetical protein WDZ62_01115 [Candidatus Pacearchaeota archaeon]
MKRENIINKIMKKRDFSQLPKEDVERAFSHFENRQVEEREKIRLTRELLHKIFGAFGGKKLLNPKRQEKPDWFLRKHLSTRERIGFYEEIYERLLDDEKVVLDLGAGVNGFSYNYFNKKFKYIAIEAVGQWVDLMNHYFKKENLKAKAFHESLFNIGQIKKIINKEKGQKVVFLFKVLDSLESMEKNYSKKILLKVCPIVSKVVVSFPTESMVRRKKFNVSRKWILDFISNSFEILDDFKIGSERFIVFSRK